MAHDKAPQGTSRRPSGDFRGFPGEQPPYDRPPYAGSPYDRPPYDRPDGCLAAAIRIPVRVVALIVVLPLRLLWEGLAVALRALGRYVLAPPLRAFGRLCEALWRYVVVPVCRVLLVVPAAWLWRWVLVPVLRAAGVAVGFLLGYLLVRPLVALWQFVLAPVGSALLWLARVLLAVPLVWLGRHVLIPVGREIGSAVAAAWRVAGYVARAVGRRIAVVFRVLIAVPVAWAWRWTGGPFFHGVAVCGRWVRRAVLHPVRQAVADARRTVRTALFGAPRHRPPAVPPQGTGPEQEPAVTPEP